jgi:hypothetical protein
MNSEKHLRILGQELVIGVSEPSDFFIEAGDGPYFGTVKTASDEMLTILLEKALSYRGSSITECTATPRYEGESFLDWEGYPARIVNLIVNIPTVTHLIGGIRKK